METIISKHQETMTLNAKNGKMNGYAYLTRKVALNTYESDGSKSLCKKVSLNAYAKWWLRMPMKMVALNAYESGGPECLWE